MEIKSAVEFFEKDYAFPHAVSGLPTKLSDVEGLEIGKFQTNDGVKLAYWTAGQGPWLVFLPGWSANGAEYINIIHLLKKEYRVVVLDYRNHGLSDSTKLGNRISRFSADLKQLLDVLDIKDAFLCGWSMGCSVIWSYMDLFGSDKIKKLIFIDEPPSIYCHSDWSEEERIKAGAFTTSAETMINMFAHRMPANRMVVDTDVFDFYTFELPAFANSHTFAETFTPQDPHMLALVLFDHILNDWRDVITNKIDRPTLVMSGENSNWAESQRWIAKTVPDGRCIIYGKDEYGDHFLHLKAPQRFAEAVTAFLRE